MGSSRRAHHRAGSAWWHALLLLVLVLVLVLPLLVAGATKPEAGERLSSREVLARARERMAGADLGSLVRDTKASARKGGTKPTTTTTVQSGDNGGGGGGTDVQEAQKEEDMNANTAKVMFETIRRMNPDLAPLREQLLGRQPQRQEAQAPPPGRPSHHHHHHQNQNALNSKIKAAPGAGKVVTRRVSKKPLPALARQASHDRLRELLGNHDLQQQQQEEEAASTTITGQQGAHSSLLEEQQQQPLAQEAEERENSALHALLQEIELNEEHRHTHAQEDGEETARFTEGTQLLPPPSGLDLLFGEPSGEEGEAGTGDDDGLKDTHSRELSPSAPRSAAERAEEAALLERLMEAYAAYTALRKEPPPFVFDVPIDLGQMRTGTDGQRAAAEQEVARRQGQGGGDTAHVDSSSSQGSALRPAAAELDL